MSVMTGRGELGQVGLAPASPAAVPSGEVLVVDRSPVFAEAVAQLLAGHEMGPVTALPAGGAAEAVAGAGPVAVLVIDADAANGVLDEVVCAVRRRSPGVRLLLLVGAGTQADEAVRRLGATGWLSRDAPTDVLVDTVHSLLGGERQRARRRRPAPEGAAGALTPRERDVLSLLARGHSNDAAAAHLAISPHTLRTHVQHLMLKLGAHTRLEAVVEARRLGIVER
jgi:two-component system nitrate/nitrite response regulator NarL